MAEDDPMDFEKLWPIIQAGAYAVAILSLIVNKVLWSKLNAKEDKIDAIRTEQLADAKKGESLAALATRINEQAAENLNLALTKRNDERAFERGEPTKRKRRRTKRRNT